MLDLDLLHKHIQALNSGDEPYRRNAIHALKPHERAEWNEVPDKIIRNLVEALAQQLPKSPEPGMKPPLFRQEVVTILGNIGPRSDAALPQLVEMLAEGVPEGIREA